MTKTVIYFTAGNVATPTEIAEINELSAVALPSLIVKVRSGVQPNVYDSNEQADFLAGVIPDAYLNEESEPIYPVVTPENPPLLVGTSQAVVSSLENLAAIPVTVNGAAAANYDVAFAISNGVITAIGIITSA
jgi:hypothetical protein